MSCVNNDELERLFSFFARYPDTGYGRDDSELIFIQSKCKEIFEKDYQVSIIPNKNGELCATYPLDLIILENSKRILSPKSVPHPSRKVNDSSKLQPLFMQGRFARVRARFPVPVILWGTKNICRSATLSQKLEYVLQTAHNQVKHQLLSGNGAPADSLTGAQMESLRNRDIGIIKQLSVKYILDLMMENKKKKFGFNVCSSEKVDMHDRYAPFVIASIPYPGVEFFQEFNQRKHCANDLRFDWDKPEDVVELKVDLVKGPVQQSGGQKNGPILWEEYKTWDLVALTQNYLKLMLQFIADGSPESGILVHCISGWDRTPLFISLLRISMWADGEIHQSLCAEEILYLTVAYDWLLFSHQLSDRASRGEDIFYFCFYFLQFIHTSDFSILHQSKDKPANVPVPVSVSSSSTPVDMPGRSLRRHSRQLSADDESDFQFGSWQMMDATLSLSDRYSSIPEEPYTSFHSIPIPKPEFDNDHSNGDSSFESSASSYSDEGTPRMIGIEQRDEPSNCTDNNNYNSHNNDGQEPQLQPQPDEIKTIDSRAQKLKQLRDLSLSLYEKCCTRNDNDNRKWMTNGIWRLLPRFV